MLQTAWPRKSNRHSGASGGNSSKSKPDKKGARGTGAPTTIAQPLADETGGQEKKTETSAPKRKRRGTRASETDQGVASGLPDAAQAVSGAEQTSSAVPERPMNKKLRGDDTPAGDTQATRARGKFQAPRIDVDKPSSDDEPTALPPRLQRSSNQQRAGRIDDKIAGEDDGKLNEDGEDVLPKDDMKDDDDESGAEPEERDMGVAVNIVAEAVTFTRTCTDAEKPSAPVSRSRSTVPYSGQPTKYKGRLMGDSRSHSRTSTPSIIDTESAVDGPETSENDSLDRRQRRRQGSEGSGSQYEDLAEDLSELNSEEDVGTELHAHHNSRARSKVTSMKMTHREKKLKDELPQVSSSSHAHNTLTAASGDGEIRSWLPCTDISIALSQTSGKSWNLKKSKLRSEMSKVVDEGIRQAKIALLFGQYDIDLNVSGTQYTPFGVQGLENYAIDALILAAETLRYDGENDIAHRLEAGSSAEYIDPLCGYVAKRLRTYRLAIKASALQTIPMVLKFSDIGDVGIQQLLDRDNFIYPRTAQGAFNRSKPFAGEGFAEVIKAAFYTQQQYHDVGLKTVHLLRSTSTRLPHQKEIPPTMLALTATAIQAVITDRASHTTSDFAGQGLHGSYLGHLQNVLDFRTNRPVTYHELMHRMAVAVMDGTVHTQSIGGGGQGHSRIDWDSIVEPAEPAL